MTPSPPTQTDQEFRLPPDADVYTGVVIDRVEGLIETAVWDGLELVTLRSWLGNFRTELERYFAACVLDALIYRSQAQTLAMMRQLLERCLVDLGRLNPPGDGLADWFAALCGRKQQGDPRMRVVPVIRNEDPPTKSGVIVARLYKRYLGLNQEWMIWPWQIPQAIADGVKRFLFVDDFLGTGSQFTRFVEHFGIRDHLKAAYAVYAPLAAHRDGIDALRTAVPEVWVCAVEVLDDRYGLFDPQSKVFDDEVNTPAAAQALHSKLLDERVKPGKRYREGFGELQLAYAFSHAVPNNCLPILWMESPEWTPLFER